jgi:hypothetical protein
MTLNIVEYFIEYNMGVPYNININYENLSITFNEQQIRHFL